ncbi:MULTISPECIES: hypothetical protein [unclassified Enterococcus]|uniref:hypothetical protein n=1 Tax=unclassified Enterococcus TaxID=2608891 RepID=UPI001552A6C4|nr:MULTISPECIES: hypothetical protein [unclassified Enterococcus]MBS7577971.1 hypothetical protein [Enterococcus sp. MMGLQ5-2]MBS7585168.1 hypothetical protein [Enterococcus sp. MMGLQ5-1]NPD13025.1 hypothetical protein [Enterococcus sp. MMGLQ5-1]NPD37801.1 hypothetical protein [Enterococcus sp. MMGLQ5-2]
MNKISVNLHKLIRQSAESAIDNFDTERYTLSFENQDDLAKQVAILTNSISDELRESINLELQVLISKDIVRKLNK